jgi:hypothetical protein
MAIFECSTNIITNPNPAYSHSITRQCSVRISQESHYISATKTIVLMRLTFVVKIKWSTEFGDVCCRDGDFVYFTEGSDRNAAVCGLDFGNVCDAYDSLGDRRRVETLHDNNIRAVRRRVSGLRVSVKVQCFLILNAA